jgi:Sap, sulfolipid-1-addressing protein
MGQAIGEILPFAVGVALSPVPIIAVILMLVTPRARVSGPAFVVGWLTGLAVVGRSSSSSPARRTRTTTASRRPGPMS